MNRDRVTVQEVTDLKKGEFFGQIVESDVSYLRTQFKPDPIDRKEIVPFNTVTDEDVKANYSRISEEIKSLLANKDVPKIDIESSIPTKKPNVEDEF